MLHGDTGNIAIHSLADELAHEPDVADRLALLLNVKLREEPVVDVPIAFAAPDRRDDVIMREGLAFQTLPKLRFGQTALRESAQRRDVRFLRRSYSAEMGAGSCAEPFLETVATSCSRILALISSAKSECSSR